MNVDIDVIGDRLEKFVREQFLVADDDPGFGRDVDLYELGYVDSVGLVELLAFIEEEFGLEVPESELLSPEFSSLDGIARTIATLI